MKFNAQSGWLASYATRVEHSRGRLHSEPEHVFRSIYQRDRDRIIHSTAFRRLEYKTQVFINHEGDHYRTRLTHTLEVDQISRTIARALGLNEDLTEAIALAHDLGHTPFGHAGERTLNDLVHEAGGFEHNWQGLHVADFLEKRYAGFSGLNLSYEVRQAFLQHSSRPCPLPPPDDIDLSGQPSLETQVTVLADEIAYDNHDLDDGLSSGILSETELMDVPLWRKAVEACGSGYQDLPGMMRRAAGVRSMINLLVVDALAEAARRIETHQIKTPDDVRQCPEKIVMESGQLRQQKFILEKFLWEKLYRHERVVHKTRIAQRMLRSLFNVYQSQPELMPEEFRVRIDTDGLLRVTGDYVAGMTDRYAIQEYRRLVESDIEEKF